MNRATSDKANKSSQREEELAKDELNLAEYPLMLMARRVPSVSGPDGKKRPLKTIEYRDWVTINGKRKPLVWTVTGSDAFGLPTGSDQDTLVAIMEVWRESGFKDPNIPVGSIYHMLRKLGISPDGRSYHRFVASLDRLTGTYIVAENAFWDREHNCYISRKGFHIFEHYQLLDRYSRRRNGAIPLPLGYIQASDFFYQSVRNGNLKNLDLALYRNLPTPLAKRLYRYLDKKRYFGASFSIGIRKLALKLGLAETALQKYKTGKLKQLLAPAFSALIEEHFLSRYVFSIGKIEPKVTVTFVNPGMGGGSKHPQDSQADHPESIDRSQYLLSEILAVCGDKKSEAAYRKVIKEYPESLIWMVISETRQAAREGRIEKTRGAYFMDTLKRIAEMRGKAAEPLEHPRARVTNE